MLSQRVVLSVLAASSLLLTPGTARALTIAETDAGETLATAQVLNTEPFADTQIDITGSLSAPGDGPSDLADLYSVFLTPGTYTASTVGFTATGGTAEPFDTQVFLFDGSGAALLFNDNAAGGGSESTLSFTIATTGTYYLGISLFDYDPVNAATQFLFPDNDNPGTPAGTAPLSLADLALNGFAVNQSEPTLGGLGSGTYTLQLAPEPAVATNLWLVGVLGLGITRLRRSRHK